MAAFIYVMSNPAFPALYKIGKSKKDPTVDRVQELNQTGVPQPFKVEYFALVGDADGLELALHKKFHANRPNKNREFFEVSIGTVLDAIGQLADNFGGIKYSENYSDKTVSGSKLWSEGWWKLNTSIQEFDHELAQIEDINAFNATKISPLIWALYFEDAVVGRPDETLYKVKSLLRLGSDPNCTDQDIVHDEVWVGRGQTPLHYACYDSEVLSIKIYELLIAAGASVNSQVSFDGQTPLHYAVWKKPKLVECLLKHGADPNLVDFKDQPPIFFAANAGSVDCAEILLEFGSDLKFINKDGNNVLNYLCSDMTDIDPDTFKFLVESGADIHNVNKKGFNLLHSTIRYSVLFDNGYVVRYLLQKGIDPYAVNKDGKSSLDLAVEYSSWPTSKCLIECLK